jgi:hypothetical protein
MFVRFPPYVQAISQDGDFILEFELITEGQDRLANRVYGAILSLHNVAEPAP